MYKALCDMPFNQSVIQVVSILKLFLRKKDKTDFINSKKYLTKIWNSKNYWCRAY